MIPNNWRTTNPPNEVLVKAINEETKEIQIVKAFYGRDGYLPHWESEDGNTHYPVCTFIQWRNII